MEEVPRLAPFVPPVVHGEIREAPPVVPGSDPTHCRPPLRSEYDKPTWKCECTLVWRWMDDPFNSWIPRTMFDEVSGNLERGRQHNEENAAQVNVDRPDLAENQPVVAPIYTPEQMRYIETNTAPVQHEYGGEG